VVIVPCARTLYIAGQVPLDKNGELVGAADFEAQVRQTFENLKSALVAYGVADLRSRSGHRNTAML
jgi:enamine deaminase RidA (YjgF/YER057c/UK114 family)